MLNRLHAYIFNRRKNRREVIPDERRRFTSTQATKALDCSIDRFNETVTMSGDKIKEMLRKAGLE